VAQLLVLIFGFFRLLISKIDLVYEISGTHTPADGGYFRPSSVIDLILA
jgi:hypothetical protein